VRRGSLGAGADFHAADNISFFVAKQTPNLTYLAFGATGNE